MLIFETRCHQDAAVPAPGNSSRYNAIQICIEPAGVQDIQSHLAEAVDAICRWLVACRKTS